MQETQVQEAKNRLDNELKGKPQEIGIAFGMDLWAEFARRGLFTLEKFSWLGTSVAVQQLPAYQKHFAFQDWNIPVDQYRLP